MISTKNEEGEVMEQEKRVDLFASIVNAKGVTLLEQDRKEAALLAFELALALDPDNLDYLTNIGTVQYLLRNNFAAMRTFKRALKLAPTNADVCCAIGNVHYACCRYNHALKAYNQAIVLRPYQPDFHHNKSRALSNLGRAEEAERSDETAIELGYQARDESKKPDNH